MTSTGTTINEKIGYEKVDFGMEILNSTVTDELKNGVIYPIQYVGSWDTKIVILCMFPTPNRYVILNGILVRHHRHVIHSRHTQWRQWPRAQVHLQTPYASVVWLPLCIRGINALMRPSDTREVWDGYGYITNHWVWTEVDCYFYLQFSINFQ